MRAIIVIVGLVLAGCAAAPAVISDISDSSLKVQGGMGTTDAMIMAEARRGCGLYSKTPVRISHQCVDEYCIRKSVLFACR